MEPVLLTKGIRYHVWYVCSRKPIARSEGHCGLRDGVDSVVLLTGMSAGHPKNGYAWKLLLGYACHPGSERQGCAQLFAGGRNPACPQVQAALVNLAVYLMLWYCQCFA
eukprot:998104-Amphidinium_carterae.1